MAALKRPEPKEAVLEVFATGGNVEVSHWLVKEGDGWAFVGTDFSNLNGVVEIKGTMEFLP